VAVCECVSICCVACCNSTSRLVLPCYLVLARLLSTLWFRVCDDCIAVSPFDTRGGCVSLEALL